MQLRVLGGGLPVGEVIVRPATRRVAAGGAVESARGTRVARSGSTVTAHLALRLDESVAGQTLDLDVSAVDTRGRRQVEAGAGRIRVTR